MSEQTDHLSAREQLDRAVGVMRRLFRYWWVIGIVGTLGTGLAVGFALITKARYRSDCVLEYRDVIRPEVLYGQDQQRERGDVSTRLQEATLARTRLSGIIESMGLYPDIVADKGLIEAVEEMRKRIEFKAKGGDVFLLSYSGLSREQAQEVTTELAETLIKLERDANAEQVDATKTFLESQVEDASKALSAKVTAVSKFLEKHPEYAQDQFSMGQVGGGFRARQRANDRPVTAVRRTSDVVLNNLFREEARLKQRLRDVERKGARPELVRDRDLAQQELSAARRQVDSKRQSLTDIHPDMLAAKSRLRAAERRYGRARDAIKNDISNTRNPQKAAVEGEIAQVTKRIADRRAQLKQAKLKKTPVPKPIPAKEGDRPQTLADLETQWAQLYRELNQAREEYQVLESKQFIANIDAKVQSVGKSPLRYIDKPFHPTRPDGAGKKMIVLAGAFVFGFLGLGVAFILALMDDRLFDRREVERLGILPVLVVVPKRERRQKEAQAPAG